MKAPRSSAFDSLIASKNKHERMLARGTTFRKQTPEERRLRPSPDGFAEEPMTDNERQEIQDAIEKLDCAILEWQSAKKS